VFSQVEKDKNFIFFFLMHTRINKVLLLKRNYKQQQKKKEKSRK